MQLNSRILAAAFLVLAVPLTAALAQRPKVADPAQVDADFAYQGEYAGRVGQDQTPVGVQIVAEGDGRFQAVGYSGGLPGDGWNRQPPVRVQGKLQDGQLRFQADEASAEWQDASLIIYDAEGNRLRKLPKVSRVSPTLGAKPPAGAVVLFDGTQDSLANWKNGRMTDDGLLMEGTTSKQEFGDHQVHFEFRLAYQPFDRGQGRSNSGIYLQGRYEVQILDSFGLEGKDNECGGLYSVAAPRVNMCYPPLAWQTFDIDFTAARYDQEGKLSAAPRISVRHNGISVHEDVELPGERSTTAAPAKAGAEPGPIFLQNHGCPLRYRNIWIVEK